MTDVVSAILPPADNAANLIERKVKLLLLGQRDILVRCLTTDCVVSLPLALIEAVGAELPNTDELFVSIPRWLAVEKGIA